MGIVRVQSEFARLVLTDKKYADIKFIAHHNAFDFFYYVDREKIAGLLERQNEVVIAGEGGDGRGKQKGEGERRALQGKEKLKNMLLARKQTALVFHLQQLKHKLFMLKTQLTAPREERAAFEQVVWQKGDKVLSLDIDWMSRSLFCLKKNKRKYQLKVVCTCYDLVPIKYPQFADEQNYMTCFPHYIQNMLRIADRVMCISRAVEKDLLSYAKEKGISPPPTQVIRLGDNVWHQPKSKEPSDAKLRSIIKKPYILYVSTLEVRKNHLLLFEVYERLVRKYAGRLDELGELVLVGSLGWKIEEFLSRLEQNPRVKQKIHIVANLNDDDLSHAYRNCLFTVYPSFAEGWGLPVAESFSYGKACLCADNTSLPEVGGELAEYLGADDIEGWAEKIEEYLTDKKVLRGRETLIKKEYRVWRWEDFGKQVLAQ